MTWASGTWAFGDDQSGGPAPARHTVAVLCGAQRSYCEASAALEETLRDRGLEFIHIELARGHDEPMRQQILRELEEAAPVVIATTGATATSIVLRGIPDIPVVFFMVPNARDAGFMSEQSPYKTRVAGVAADVSPHDQIDWIAELCLHEKRIAVLHSSRTEQTVQAVVNAAEDRGITVEAIPCDRSEFPKAIETLNDRHVSCVLMIPDARVYNATTVQRLLLWGIRQKKPVWAFSASIVKAGGLAGQYANPDAVGRQAAELIGQLIDGTSPSELGLQYPSGPDAIGRAVNLRTAEMIGVALGNNSIGEDTVRFGEKP